MQTVKMRDGQPLAVRVVGSGQPVLMLCGLGMTSQQWLPYIAPYLTQFKFYMPDFRGIGHSRAIEFNQTNIFNNHREDVEDIIQQLLPGRFALVGYSMGASTSLHLLKHGDFSPVTRYLNIDQSPCVINQPDWTHGLLGSQQPLLFKQLQILIDLITPLAPQTTWQTLPKPKQKTLSLELLKLLNILYGKSSDIRDASILLKNAFNVPQLVSALLPTATLNQLGIYFNAYLHLAEDYRPALKTCPVPVSVLIGGKSTLYDCEGQIEMAQMTPQGQFSILKRAGHGVLLNQPLLFTRQLGRFLYEQPLIDAHLTA